MLLFIWRDMLSWLTYDVCLSCVLTRKENRTLPLTDGMVDSIYSVLRSLRHRGYYFHYLVLKYEVNLEVRKCDSFLTLPVGTFSFSSCCFLSAATIIWQNFFIFHLSLSLSLSLSLTHTHTLTVLSCFKCSSCSSAQSMWYYLSSSLHLGFCLSGPTHPHSAKSARVWLDNTEGFPLHELFSEWM